MRKTLRQRIAGVGSAGAYIPVGQGMPRDYVPVTSSVWGASYGSTTTGGVASPGGAPMVMPVSAVLVGPVTGDYVTVGMEDLAPLFTTDGAAIPAAASGGWGQVRPAGSPHPQSQRGARAPIAGASYGGATAPAPVPAVKLARS